MTKEHRLSQIEIGKKVKIKSINSNLESRSTLAGLGILPGDQLEVISKSIFGSPIYLKHGENNFFALRKNEASMVVVEPIEAEMVA